MSKTTLDLTTDKDALSLAWSEIMDARFAPAGQRFVPEHLRNLPVFTDSMYDLVQKAIIPGLSGGLGGRAKAYEKLGELGESGDKMGVGTAEMATTILARAHEIEQARADKITSLPSFDSVDDFQRYVAAAKETAAKEVAQSKVPYEPSAALAMPDSFVARFMGAPETAAPEQLSLASMSATAVQIPDAGPAPEKTSRFPIFTAIRESVQEGLGELSKHDGINLGSVGSSVNIPLDAAHPAAASAAASAPDKAPQAVAASPSFAEGAGIAPPDYVPAQGSFDAGIAPVDLLNLTASSASAQANSTTITQPAAPDKNPLTLIDIPLPTVNLHVPAVAMPTQSAASREAWKAGSPLDTAMKEQLGDATPAYKAKIVNIIDKLDGSLDEKREQLKQRTQSKVMSGNALAETADALRVVSTAAGIERGQTAQVEAPAVSAPTAPAVSGKDPHARVGTEKGRRSTDDAPATPIWTAAPERPVTPPTTTRPPPKPIDDVLVVAKKGDTLSEIAELQTKEMRELRKIVRQELGGNAKEMDVLNALAVTLAEKSGIQHIDKIKVGQKIAAVDADDIKEALGKMKANGTIDTNGRIPLAGPPRDVSELLAPVTPAQTKEAGGKAK